MLLPQLLLLPLLVLLLLLLALLHCRQAQAWLTEHQLQIRRYRASCVRPLLHTLLLAAGLTQCRGLQNGSDAQIIQCAASCWHPAAATAAVCLPDSRAGDWWCDLQPLLLLLTCTLRLLLPLLPVCTMLLLLQWLLAQATQ